jgi:hypothetical protein
MSTLLLTHTFPRTDPCMPLIQVFTFYPHACPSILLLRAGRTSRSAASDVFPDRFQSALP